MLLIAPASSHAQEGEKVVISCGQLNTETDIVLTASGGVYRQYRPGGVRGPGTPGPRIPVTWEIQSSANTCELRLTSQGKTTRYAFFKGLKPGRLTIPWSEEPLGVSSENILQVDPPAPTDTFGGWKTVSLSHRCWVHEEFQKTLGACALPQAAPVAVRDPLVPDSPAAAD